MIQKIYIKRINNSKGAMPKFISNGDWVDLYVSSSFGNRYYKAGEASVVPLGVAMRLPKGFEANVVSRSSSFKKFGFIQVNSYGIIDNSYSGDNDEWKDPVFFLKDGYISSGERICQFRVNLSQKATVWQKIKWLFTSGFKFVEVDTLGGKNRGGFGSTGVK